MKLIFRLLILLFLFSCGESEYERTLSERILEITQLEEYNNTPVVYPDSFRIKIYSFNDRIFNPYHPYQFLRDSALNEDLINLLDHEHPFVRTYAFGALHHRQQNDLFQILLEHLSDTAKFSQFTDDYGYESSVPDMMMEYIATDLTPEQKDEIIELILSKYQHLHTLDEILLFHKPIPEHYNLIKKIAKERENDKFALVALAKYQEQEDVELVRRGFYPNKHDFGYFSGVKVFFIGIEEFNHPSFIPNLLEYKNSLNKGFSHQGHDHYFNALAKYDDKECTDVLKEFVNVSDYKNDHYKQGNLKMIYRALKKYESTNYRELITQIESEFSSLKELNEYDEFLSSNPWNY